MNCKICDKDITSIHFFTKKPYCSLMCEEKDSGDDAVDKLKDMLGINS